MTVAGRVVRSAIISSLSGYGLQIITLISSMILTRLLTTQQFGAFGLALAISLFFSRIRLWGFESLLLAKTEPDDLDISTQFWLNCGLGVTTILLIALAAPLLRLGYDPYVVNLTLYVTMISLFESFGITSTLDAMLARDLRYGTISSLSVTATLLGIAITIVGAALGWGTDALLAGYCVRIMFYFIAALILTPRRPKFMFSVQRARDYFREGRHLLWGGIGTFLAYQYDDLAVGTLAGQATLGLYQRAYTLSLVPMSLVGGALGMAAATYTNVKTDRRALSEAVRYMLDVVALIVLPASTGLALIAPEFISLVNGADWVGAAPMLQLLLVYSMVRPLNDAVGSLATIVGRNDILRRYGIIQAVVMVISCTVLTLVWGAYGAAISAGLTVVIALAFLIQKLLIPTVDINYRAIFAPPLLSVIVGAVVALGAPLIWKPEGLLAAMLYKGAIFSIIFALMLLVVGREAMIMRVQRIYGALVGRSAVPVPPAEGVQPT